MTVRRSSGPASIPAARAVSPDRLRDRLRLIVITDAELARPRDLSSVVRSALRGGAPAVQLRAKRADARELAALGRSLLELTAEAGALLLVNDRLDVALAIGADGVHLGPEDLPVTAARRAAPHLLIGYSTDDPGEAVRAVRDGADYLGVGAVWPTTSKEDAGRAIGPEGLARVAHAAPVPVVGIGGVTAERARLLRGTGAAGVAVLGAVMAAPDPEGAVREILEAFAG